MAMATETKAVEKADCKRSPQAGLVPGLQSGPMLHTWADWVEPDRTGHFYGAFKATRTQG